MRRLRPHLCLALALAAAQPAAAQVVVHDPTSYASLLRQAQTAAEQLQTLRGQLEEARRLSDRLNNPAGLADLAPVLAAPGLRGALPELEAVRRAADGDLAALGALAPRATALREAARLYRPAPEDEPGQALARTGDRAARDQALAEAAAEAGDRRRPGLQQLAGAIGTAPTARGVLELQARLAAEQALTANDQLRLQALAMSQAAEQRLADQRLRERAAAAAAARRALFQGALP
ncbi:type IV secretion system protein [Phenylobacterium deserti]|uniref:Type IV secretion system protein n=1 Tax=Phenylobacterium deserti TaxID=1914756 RepID=A0A328AD73_9CAUL|nr:type IV secretion system protein [Phenylobacterium deserti]RAK52773.1 type IV secretion system protein [Phenylobacterium deserti]